MVGQQHKKPIDVLCVGHACYDMVYSVEKQPQSDEKIFANALDNSGGGPAANAAVAIARLGYKSGFAGYLGYDVFGDLHQAEFDHEGVDCRYLIRGQSPTPLSSVLVKPDASRCLINYKGQTRALEKNALDFSGLNARVVLFDGHEPAISQAIISVIDQESTQTVLDAGSVHEGTLALMGQVDYLVASEKFAVQYAGDVHKALKQLSTMAEHVVITLGEKGVIWQIGLEYGRMKAAQIEAIDTTGAGDAFHAAFSVAILNGLDWHDTLAYASAAGSLCCMKTGARQGMPYFQEHNQLYRQIIKQHSR